MMQKATPRLNIDLQQTQHAQKNSMLQFVHSEAVPNGSYLSQGLHQTLNIYLVRNNIIETKLTSFAQAVINFRVSALQNIGFSKTVQITTSSHPGVVKLPSYLP